MVASVVKGYYKLLIFCRNIASRAGYRDELNKMTEIQHWAPAYVDPFYLKNPFSFYCLPQFSLNCAKECQLSAVTKGIPEEYFGGIEGGWIRSVLFAPNY